MIIDHRPALRTLNMPARKTLQKKGTIAVAMVETTPVVWKGELLRFEWLRNNEWDTAKVNVSDLDLCDYNGKTVIIYSWGNQLGNEFLAWAEYDGSSEEFLKSFYVN